MISLAVLAAGWVVVLSPGDYAILKFPPLSRHSREEGNTDKAVCEELGISTRQFLRWRDELRLLGDEAFPGQGRTRDEELARLKRELAQVKKERDFLREAAAYFAKESK